MTLYGIYRKYDKEAQKQKLPEQVQISTPAKQSNVEIHPINSLPTNDTIPAPHPVLEDIEIVVGVHDNEDGKIASEDLFHEPPRGPPCNVDAQKIVGVPAPLTVQLVQCAV